MKNYKPSIAADDGTTTLFYNLFEGFVENVVQKVPGGQFVLQYVLQTLFKIYDAVKKGSNSEQNKLRQFSFCGAKTALNLLLPSTIADSTTSESTTETDRVLNSQQFPLLELSEASVRYGITMLRQSGGGPRATIHPENTYEKQLLSQVLSPEDLGAGKGSGSHDIPAGFSHVGALKKAKQVLQETVQLPLQRPDLFQHGALAKPPSGVLLFGPPGTGKTLLARATAAESGASFLELSLSSLSSKYFGDSTKLVVAAFSLAEKLAPCVLFVDEVDALLGRRSSTGREHEATRELKNEFMSRWDSIRTTSTNRTTGWVMVLGATNRPFDLDEAVLRRFSVRVAVELPDKISRREILNVILEGQPKEESVDVEKIAEDTEGFSGADLRQLCVAAAMRPIRELIRGKTSDAAMGIEEEESGDRAQSNGALTTPIKSQSMADTSSSVPLSSPQLVSAFADATNLAQGSTGGYFLGNSVAGDGGGGASLEQQRPRPVNQADFSAARRDVGPTVDLDSSVTQELKEWDKKFGSVGGANRRGGADSRLLYYT
jgi:DNA polymerase III delta prime subunit